MNPDDPPNMSALARDDCLPLDPALLTPPAQLTPTTEQSSLSDEGPTRRRSGRHRSTLQRASYRDPVSSDSEDDLTAMPANAVLASSSPTTLAAAKRTYGSEEEDFDDDGDKNPLPTKRARLDASQAPTPSSNDDISSTIPQSWRWAPQAGHLVACEASNSHLEQLDFPAGSWRGTIAPSDPIRSNDFFRQQCCVDACGQTFKGSSWKPWKIRTHMIECASRRQSFGAGRDALARLAELQLEAMRKGVVTRKSRARNISQSDASTASPTPDPSSSSSLSAPQPLSSASLPNSAPPFSSATHLPVSLPPSAQSTTAHDHDQNRRPAFVVPPTSTYADLGAIACVACGELVNSSSSVDHACTPATSTHGKNVATSTTITAAAATHTPAVATPMVVDDAQAQRKLTRATRSMVHAGVSRHVLDNKSATDPPPPKSINGHTPLEFAPARPKKQSEIDTWSTTTTTDYVLSTGLPLYRPSRHQSASAQTNDRERPRGRARKRRENESAASIANDAETSGVNSDGQWTTVPEDRREGVIRVVARRELIPAPLPTVIIERTSLATESETSGRSSSSSISSSSPTTTTTTVERLHPFSVTHLRGSSSTVVSICDFQIDFASLLWQSSDGHTRGKHAAQDAQVALRCSELSFMLADDKIEALKSIGTVVVEM